jgi:hypothetical protein
VRPRRAETLDAQVLLSPIAQSCKGRSVSRRRRIAVRLFDEISARAAAVRASALKERHAFKTEMDDEARRNMFPQNLTNPA